MSVDLTLYLLKDTVTDVDSVFTDDDGCPKGFVEIQRRPTLQGEFRCWVKKNKAKPPEWMDWLVVGFDFGANAPENQSSGCIVVLEAGGRVFAVSFGTGHHAVPDELVDPDFGLTVALNVVNPKQLQNLVTKTIDVRTRQRDTSKTSGAELPEFAIDLDVEWLRGARGRADSMACNLVQGTEALHLYGWKQSLDGLTEACEDLLKVFAKGLPETFSFARNIKPIPEHDPLHAKLEGDLGAAAQLPFFEHISLSIDARLAHQATKCTLHCGKSPPWELKAPDDESLEAALTELAALEPSFELSKVTLRLFNGEGDQIYRQTLDRLLQMEIDYLGEWYVRIERRWFLVRGDHMAKIASRVAEFEETPSPMPAWSRTTYQGKPTYVEGDYNATAATAKGWLLQDKKLHSGIEPCDLLTPTKHFIHVKKGTEGSSELSHLFGQASGSADMLARDTAYYNEMKLRFETHWPGTVFEGPGKTKVILAIAREPGQDLFGKMMLSRLNALEHARRIQSRGFDVAIWRVDLV
jgi:uncharacterized protein (TIGR04141 family)